MTSSTPPASQPEEPDASASATVAASTPPAGTAQSAGVTPMPASTAGAPPGPAPEAEEPIAWSPEWVRKVVARLGFRGTILTVVGILVAGGVVEGVTGVIGSGIKGVSHSIFGHDSTSPPVQVAVTGMQVNALCSSPVFVFPDYQAFVRGGPAPGPAALASPAWAVSRGGAQAVGLVKFSVQSPSNEPVLLTDLKLEVLSRKPATGFRLYATGCGGGVITRHFRADFTPTHPTLVSEPGLDSAGNTTPAVTFPLQVSTNSLEYIQVQAMPTNCDCTWDLRLDWVAGGKSDHTIIQNGSRPFRSTSAPLYGIDDPTNLASLHPKQD